MKVTKTKIGKTTNNLVKHVDFSNQLTWANKQADNTNNKNQPFQPPENKHNNHYNLNTETNAKRTQACNDIKTKTL